MSESSATSRAASSCGREHSPLTSPMLDDPRPFYARARREEPVFWSESLGLWVVTRYDDVSAAAKDAARFSSLDSITPSVAPPLSLAPPPGASNRWSSRGPLRSQVTALSEQVAGATGAVCTLPPNSALNLTAASWRPAGISRLAAGYCDVGRQRGSLSGIQEGLQHETSKLQQ